MTKTLQSDAVKLLARLIGECDGAPDAHAWRKCRRCIALNELENRDPLAVRLVEAAIAGLHEAVAAKAAP